jgi:hypothetical protein
MPPDFVRGDDQEATRVTVEPGGAPQCKPSDRLRDLGGAESLDLYQSRSSFPLR